MYSIGILTSTTKLLARNSNELMEVNFIFPVRTAKGGSLVP
jgi:hypothetical protein